MSERTVTVAEAAAALGISEKAVRRRIERGVLASVLVAGRRRVPATAVGVAVDAAPPPHEVAHAAPVAAASAAPRVAPRSVDPAVIAALERIERLAREAGRVPLLEELAGRDRQALLEAHARIRELEEQLAARPRRWWHRRATP